MSIYEAGDDSGLGSSLAGAGAPAPASAMMAESGALDTPGAAEPGAVAVVKAFKDKQIDPASLAPPYLAMFAGIFLSLWMPLFFNSDKGTDFFLFWLLWIVGWVIATYGILEWFAPKWLKGGQAGAVRCGMEQAKPWLGIWLAWVICIIVYGMLSDDDIFDAGPGSSWFSDLMVGLITAMTGALTIVGMTFLFSRVEIIPTPIQLSRNESRTGCCAWTVCIVFLLLYVEFSMIAESFESDSFIVMRGRSTHRGQAEDGNLRGKCAQRDELHEVRCCSDSYIEGYTQKAGCPYAESQFREIGCQESKSYEEARKICEEDGARLCTQQEVANDCTAGTGCWHDADLVWTATECAGDSFTNAMKAEANAVLSHVAPSQHGYNYMKAPNVSCAPIKNRNAAGQCLTALSKLEMATNLPVAADPTGADTTKIVVFPTKMNYNQSQCFCSSMGGSLASVRNAAEYIALQKAASAAGVTGPVFLGAMRLKNPGLKDFAASYRNEWVWTDGWGKIDTQGSNQALFPHAMDNGPYEDQMVYCPTDCFDECRNANLTPGQVSNKVTGITDCGAMDVKSARYLSPHGVVRGYHPACKLDGPKPPAPAPTPPAPPVAGR